MGGKVAKAEPAMPVAKDPRGTFPRTKSWTVSDPDGYDYSVGDFNGVITCFAHGEKCAHVEAVTVFNGGKVA